MSSAIRHRGPDDEGLWLEPQGRLALAHQRLSIVDLSPRGHQPMSYGGRFTIAFNGEIYNFRQLRGRLTALGHTFRSDTDTEVLMAAVGEWGISRALQELVGMFAFALWDSEQQTLYLARDRLGEKPLHLAMSQGHLLFGSELRAVESALEQRELNPTALAAYLQNGYVPGPSSLWKGVAKLPPATFLKIGIREPHAVQIDAQTGTISTAGAARFEKYWTVPAQSASAPGADDKQLDRLDELLRESTAMQMLCDVPIGVFLSGGIDSTVVAALAQAQNSDAISTYTVKFDSPEFDESVHSAAVAAHLGTKHHEIVLDLKTLVEQVPALAASFDEPTANASYFPLHMMARQARRSVKVVLSGDGGDELFGGYNRYKLTPALWKKVSKVPGGIRRGVAGLLQHMPSSLIGALSSGQQISGQLSSAGATRKLLRVLRSESLADSYRKLMWCWENPAAAAFVRNPQRDESQWADSSFLASATRHDMVCYLPDDNLAKMDRATMSAGLEARVPLLDHRIVEFAFGLPDNLRIRGDQTKWLLRQLAYRYVPQNLLERPKMGFTVPIRQWLTGPLRDWSADLLHSSNLYQHGLLKQEPVQKAWRNYQRGDNGTSWEIWALTMYAAWLNGKTGAAAP